MQFCHITPVGYMDVSEKYSGRNLALAHIADEDPVYVHNLANSKLYTILDNGAFENGKPMPFDKLLKIAERVNADALVLPDYPGVNFNSALEKMNNEFIKELVDRDIAVMFVPQSEKGDANSYFASWEWALSHPDIDIVGNSILGAPNALPNVPRLFARYMVLERIYGMCKDKSKIVSKIHMLGMLDNVHEISLTKPFHDCIASWDSSVASWTAIHEVDMRKLHKKFEAPVDFNYPRQGSFVAQIIENMKYINNLVG